MAFSVESAISGARIVVTVRGEVDIATAGTLRTHLREAVAAARHVVVDLGDVPFMDSTGLGVLADAATRAREHDTHVVIARPHRIVKNALRLVQIDAVVRVYDTLDAAMAAD